MSAIKIAVIAGAAIVVVTICNQNRANLGTLEGVPWVIPIVLAVFGAWTILLTRTRYGRYVYAIGGNPEAARRAGVNLANVRTIAFVISGSKRSQSGSSSFPLKSAGMPSMLHGAGSRS